MHRESIPVVICNSDLPDGNWRCLVDQSQGTQPPPKVIVSSREVNDYLWADVLQMGGYDFLPMPWEPRDVLKVVAFAWHSWEFARRAASPIPRPARSVQGLAQAAAATAG
jgi:DNA-binding NtrC family response regulator